jgi:hypothetical protein
LRRLSLILAVAVAAAACGGDATGPARDVPDALVGVWVAEPACLPECEFTVFDRQHPANSINFVAFGLGVEMHVQATGRFRMEVRLARDTLLDGTVRVEGDRMLVSSTGTATVDTLDFTLAEPWLEIQLRSRLAYDLDADGTEEDVGLRGMFRRR